MMGRKIVSWVHPQTDEHEKEYIEIVLVKPLILVLGLQRCYFVLKYPKIIEQFMNLCIWRKVWNLANPVGAGQTYGMIWEQPDIILMCPLSVPQSLKPWLDLKSFQFPVFHPNTRIVSEYS